MSQFQIFEKCLDELSNGADYNEMTKEYVPKTESDVEKIRKRGILTKENLHRNAFKLVCDQLTKYPGDYYLNEVKLTLEKKDQTKFNPKQSLIEFCSQIDTYVENLSIESEVSNLYDSDCE